MTKKEKLQGMVKSIMILPENLRKEAYLNFEYRLPYSSEDELSEIISIPIDHVKRKMEYIEDMYTDDLKMKANNRVEIIDFYWF